MANTPWLTALAAKSAHASGSFDGTELFRIGFGGVSKKTTTADLFAYLRTLSNTWAAAQTFSAGAVVASGQSLAWSTDLFLHREAANTLAQRNGTTAQVFQIYNTWSGSGTNFERGIMRWTGNTLEIGTQSGGTGTIRSWKMRGASVNYISSDNIYLNNSADTLTGGIMTVYNTNVMGFRNSLFANSPLIVIGANNDASFPAIKNSGAALHVRLANDSAFAELVFKLPTANPGPGTLWNNGGTLTIGT